MSILVVGSIALDNVETPKAKADNLPGGSALYFSTAASLFSPVNVVGVVGQDFDHKQIQFLQERRVDLSGVTTEEGETFRWGGRYHENMNSRDTLFTFLNVFETFEPKLPEKYRQSPFIFLANIDPELQLRVLESAGTPALVVLDTMNFWISGKRDALEEVIRRVDVMILNDEELRELTGIFSLSEAARSLLKQGPSALVVKKGEHGAVLISQNDYFSCPAYPVEEVVDPTGAGDSFAGGFLGYLASLKNPLPDDYRRAVVYGNTVASFNVESFSFERLKDISKEEVEQRVNHLREITRF
ncbi:MAG: PfkB family carbohydrate kinase [Calditrichia bacterium]